MVNQTSRFLNDRSHENLENRKSVLVFKATLLELLQAEKSFNIKNYFCNSNYGFSNGAHHNINSQLLHFSTNVLYSNYECLIDESRSLTVKYSITKELLGGTSNQVDKFDFNDSYKKLSAVNDHEIIHIKLNNYLPYEKIINCLHSGVNLISEKSKFISMEYVNLMYRIEAANYGFILYRAKLNLKKGFILYVKSDYVRDYGMIICDYKNHLVTINNILVAPTNRTIKIKLDFEFS